MHSAIRKLFVSLGYIVSTLVLLTGVLVVITCILTAVLNHHHDDFEKSLSELLQRPIKVENLNLGWHHYYYPEIDLEQVTVLDPQTQTPRLRIDRVRMNFNLWNSLKHWKVIISNITLSGVDITIKQESAGQIKIANLISFNMRDQHTGALLQPNEMQRWIFSQRRLALENIHIHLITPAEPNRLVSLDSVILRNNDAHHVINGEVSLQQKNPATLKVHFDWMGDVDKYLIASGELRLDLNNFSLSHWLSEIKWQGYEVKEGLVSGTLLTSWKDNQWVTSQFNVQGKNIALAGANGNLQFNVDQIASNINLNNTTKVSTSGKIDISNGNLSSMGNKIALTNVNGTLNISDNKITSNTISAQLFNSPVTLNIASDNSVNLSANLLNISGQEIHKAKINLTADKDNWKINMKSDELAGDLALPSHSSAKTLGIHLQYLHLNTSKVSKNTTTRTENPAEFPALSLDCDDMRINSYSFGHIRLTTAPGNGGMIIRELSMRDNDMQLNASGEWIGSRTRLQGEMSSQEINALLRKWNLNVSNFSGSSANIQFNLNWNGPAYDLTLTKLNGHLSLRLGAGNITGLSQSTNAKIGMANLLNLFSLSSLPGLNVHPANSAQNGYSFSSLTANFELRSGNAFTDDMIFHSTIADVAIKGRLGLAAEDFDLRMGVTAHMTGSLPLVATLAGGPIAGAATWVASQVMSSAPSASSTYQYRVSGPWSRPSMSKE